MPATTRSANKQIKLEDVGAGFVATAKKRKANDEQKNSTSKSLKQAKTPESNSKGSSATDHDDTVTINRAPVLELWSSCVAQFLHPSVSWETCLSVGSAISTITAISKGRSIGKIDKPDPGEAQKKAKDRKSKATKENLDELEVMSFKLNLDNNGHALVGGKPKKAGEDALIKKYGGSEQYQKVKKTFQDALESWKGQDEELNGNAFKFYEDFRPSIQPGQQGWGRQGQLNMQTIKSVVIKE